MPKILKFKSGRLLTGSCLDRLKDLKDDSIDSVVTDPPYELSFMGKAWDGSGVAYQVELWAECLRVLKPGGHLLAFGGTRTYHRMVVAIEDAGFEVRDSIHWTYGSGFPKSLDVSKAIDKQRYDRADIYRVTTWIRETRDAKGITNKDIDAAFGFAGMAGHWTSGKSQPAVPTLEQVPRLLEVLGVTLDDVPDDIKRLLWDLNGMAGEPGVNWARREVVGEHEQPPAGATWRRNNGLSADLTARERRDNPATDAAAKWQGWGTALKPSHEPIVIARKPLAGTVAVNVLEHGTGALNIDGCRIGTDGGGTLCTNRDRLGKCRGHDNAGRSTSGATVHGPDSTSGRWPANTVLTHAADCGSDCAPGCPVAALDQQSGVSKSQEGRIGKKAQGTVAIGGAGTYEAGDPGFGDTGGASRFFTVTEWEPQWDDPFLYVAKPSKRERNAGLDGLPQKRGKANKPAKPHDKNKTATGPTLTYSSQNFHPTVKPVALMRWLCRLTVPPGGTVLDPFLGSGTTAVAAILEGFNWVGCEMTDDYLPIIKGRVKHAQKQADKQQPELPLTEQPAATDASGHDEPPREHATDHAARPQ